jgi:hypothetical protein
MSESQISISRYATIGKLRDVRGVTSRFLVNISCCVYLLPDVRIDDTSFICNQECNSLFLTITRYLYLLCDIPRNTY